MKGKELIVNKCIFYSLKRIELKNILLDILSLKNKLVNNKVIDSTHLIEKDIRKKIRSLESLCFKEFLKLIYDSSEDFTSKIVEEEFNHVYDNNYELSVVGSTPTIITHLSTYDLKQGFIIINKLCIDDDKQLSERKYYINLHTGLLLPVEKNKLQQVMPISINDVFKNVKFTNY